MGREKAAGGDLPGRARIARLAWPIVLANCAVPLLGLVDTAVIGRTGTVEALGAIALGALVFSFVYWSFGFLRMGTTGLAAQASGAGDQAEVRAAVGRALLAGAALGLLILLLQRPIARLALALLDASAGVETITRAYLLTRVWGAPATLATFAVNGALIGLGATRRLLAVQLFLNGLNMALDVLFAGVLGWGARGIALGTALSEWTALGFGLWLLLGLLRERRRDGEPFWPPERLRDTAKLLGTVRVNADIMVRTIFLMLGFAWFTNQGARYGDVTLAANHVLLQLVSFTAFFLDGFAFATESLVGEAVGGRRVDLFDAATRRSSELAATTAALLAGAVWLLGPALIAELTDLPAVRGTATHYLPFAAVYVLLSFPAFQLDGIFIGATRTRAMRNASIASLAVFLVAWRLLALGRGNRGLWIAFIVYVVARAVALAVPFRALRASIAPERERGAFLDGTTGRS
ncbi:MAG: MATE family efflux transporter [Thermoanaerobaculia bacterium]